MTAREIAYSRDEANETVGVCPCCGKTEDKLPLACWPCYSEYEYVLRTIAGPGRVSRRDAFYSLGLRLRAEGKMPPLSPAAAAVCSECRVAPCDCEKEIWTYYARIKHTGEVVKRLERTYTRKSIEEWRRDEPAMFDIGPVQRVSDPPHDFGKTSGCVGRDGAAPVKANAATPTPAGLPEEPAFSSAALARALFDEEMERDAKRACEYSARTVPGPYADACDRIAAADAEVRRILDVMWTKTKPDVRKRAEELAARVCARLGRKA